MNEVNKMCGTRPIDQRTTLADLYQTIDVMRDHYGYYRYSHVLNRHYYIAVEAVLRNIDNLHRYHGVLVKPRQYNDYVSHTSTIEFDVEEWKSIFKYQLWDAFVSYAYAQGDMIINNDPDLNANVVCFLVSARLELDKYLEQDYAKEWRTDEILRGAILTMPQVFHALWKTFSWRIRWKWFYKPISLFNVKKAKVKGFLRRRLSHA